MALDGTFGQLAQEFPERLSNIHASIGALLKIVGASAAADHCLVAEKERQQHQQQQPSTSNDPSRLDLDSADDDSEVDEAVREGKIVGKANKIKATMNNKSRSRIRRSSVQAVLLKRKLWETFGNKKVDINVSLASLIFLFRSIE